MDAALGVPAPQPEAHPTLSSLVREVENDFGVKAKPIPNNSRVHGRVVRISVGEHHRERAVIVNDQAIYVVSLPPGTATTVGQTMALDRTGDHIRMTPVRSLQQRAELGR